MVIARLLNENILNLKTDAFLPIELHLFFTNYNSSKQSNHPKTDYATFLTATTTA